MFPSDPKDMQSADMQCTQENSVYEHSLQKTFLPRTSKGPSKISGRLFNVKSSFGGFRIINLQKS